MAYLTVNKDGTELISEEMLERWPYIEKEDRRIKNRKQILSKDDQYAWVWPYMSEDGGQVVMLPKGSIEKLIGRKLTWEDEPYKMDEVVNTSNLIKCYDCKNVFKYSDSDIVNDVFVKCPECGQELCILD